MGQDDTSGDSGFPKCRSTSNSTAEDDGENLPIEEIVDDRLITPKSFPAVSASASDDMMSIPSEKIVDVKGKDMVENVPQHDLVDDLVQQEFRLRLPREPSFTWPFDDTRQ